MSKLDDIKAKAAERQTKASQQPELKLNVKISKKNLQRAIHDLMDTKYYGDHAMPYVGLILQCIHIQFNTDIPTAGVMFDLKTKQFRMLINPYFFDQLDRDERVAVLKHEIMHITHKHLTIGFKYPTKERPLLNVAMDLVINQYIKQLPEGAMLIEDFETVEGEKFPENKYFEYYYEELKKQQEKMEKEGKGKGNSAGQKLTNMKGDAVETIDEHDWDGADEDELEALKAANDLFKRAKQKASMSYSTSPKELDDIIKEFSETISAINHKKLLEMAYKKTLPNSDREHSWKRPSKRFGKYARGTKDGTSPYIASYIDTSGSISVDEFNLFLGNNDKFLKFANKKCSLSMFHTDIYHTEKYKMGRNVHLGEVIKGGGTDLGPVMKDIQKRKPDMAIILTDGYYSDVDIKGKMPPILFIITEGGMESHPLKRFGRTVKIK